MQIHQLGLSTVLLLLAIVAPVVLLAWLVAPLVLPPFHHLAITHRGVSYRQITGRQVCPWAEHGGFGVLLRMKRFFTWRAGYVTTADWFVVGGLASGGPLYAPDGYYPLEIDARAFSPLLADQQQVATEMALWLNELAIAVAEGRLSEGVALPAILSGQATAIKGATQENDAEVHRAETETAGAHPARMAAERASNARTEAAVRGPLPRSFDPKTGELISASGERRILTDEEMAAYWHGEAAGAARLEQGDAASDAMWKAEFYKHRARAQRKQRSAERKKPK
jgi:hypothetical protein